MRVTSLWATNHYKHALWVRAVRPTLSPTYYGRAAVRCGFLAVHTHTHTQFHFDFSIW